MSNQKKRSLKLRVNPWGFSLKWFSMELKEEATSVSFEPESALTEGETKRITDQGQTVSGENEKPKQKLHR